MGNKQTINKQTINKQTRTQAKQKQDRNYMNDAQKIHRLGTVSKIFYWMALTGFTARQPHPSFRCRSRHIDVWCA